MENDLIMIKNSLFKSDLRVKILVYLYGIYPEKTNITTICRSVNSDAGNVSGAIRGNRGYNENRSLMYLGLITAESPTGRNKCLYVLTEMGYQIARDTYEQYEYRYGQKESMIEKHIKI